MTTPTDPPASTRSDDHCYRHPDRTSFALCQRCARTICGECQTPAAVGVICPECRKADRASAPRTKAFGRRVGGSTSWASARPAGGRRFQPPGGTPPVTFWLMVACAVVYVAQLITQWLNVPVVDALGAYAPMFTDLRHGVFEPWRMLTAAFLHASPLHLIFNLLTLWVFGRALEPLLGTWRFLTLYVVSALGGSLAVALLAPTSWVIGASGAVFGLFGAWFVVLRRMHADLSPMLVLIGINVVMAFMNPGVSWEAHLGGALVGAGCGWLALRDLDHADRGARIGLWLMLLVGVLCVALPPLLGRVR